MIIEYDKGTILKRPSAAGDDGRLEREAALLERARHAGVVTLLDAGRDERGLWLRLEDAGGVTIETMLSAGAQAGLAADGVAEVRATIRPLLASVATTIADLHDIGVVHGAIDASHVLVDRGGHALLCSFGRGGYDGQVDLQVDVIALARLLETVLGEDISAPLAALLEVAGSGLAAGRGRRTVSAREVAEALRDELGGPRWRGTSPRVLRPRVSGYGVAGRMPTLRPPRPPAAAALAAVGVAIVIVIGMQVAPGGGRPRPARPGPTPAGPFPFTYQDGVLSFSGQRFAVGSPGDQVTVGRWFCQQPEVALLRPDGSIYVFDGLARSGVDVEGRHVARAPGARWFRSRPDAKAGCDVLVVGGQKGSAVVKPVAA
jgi:tRNA A-37 threonylcarbamoyl transferase component Bud32